jgi:hypothetical protein
MTRRLVAAWFALLLFAPVVPDLHAQNAVFSSKVEAVRVDVLVTERENGPAIVGLGAADFEVFDNGVAQTVDLLSYTPRNVPPDGWHKLEVRVKGRRAAIKARPGYLAGR